MLNFMTIPPENDRYAQMIKRRLEESFKDIEGLCYYKHSMAKTPNDIFPDFTVFTKTTQPIVIKIVPYQLQEIDLADTEVWIVNNTPIEPPPAELENLVISIDNQFRIEKRLRNVLKPQAILALPFVIQKDFEDKLGNIQEDVHIYWENSNLGIFLHPLENKLTDEQWTLTRAIIQGVTNLHKPSKFVTPNITTLGAAIRELDKDIAALDDEQEAATTKIAPGPQRIRGLAGTGKTVLLAIKAANIHLLNKDKKILFTFNTQSLYNQAKSLISDVYRGRTGEEPNWDFLHVRHAWGGSRKQGVYSDLCARQGITPLNFNDLRGVNDPFQRCCLHVLRNPIMPEYDFILVDEAQDFPKEFFRVLYKLASSDHRIYWAYDELQSLSSLEIPKPEDLFGRDEQGNPLVTLDGNDYPENIEKDIVLRKAYRCPLPVLMLAHGIGLGIKSQTGCVQMLENKSDWEAVGYEIEGGELQEGKEVVVVRSINNSPNRIYDIYDKQELITTQVFQNREDELASVAASIQRDIKEEKVAPHKIVVISLDNSQAKSHFVKLKSLLVSYGIASVAPGILDGASEFGVVDYVTLATVYRAKGNENHIVYIINFDALYDYIEGIGNRNKAFASITRSKAWVRITGTGRKMREAQVEIENILADIPRLKFIFPDMKKIRRLGAENSKRVKVVESANKSANVLIGTDPEALEAMDIEKLKKLQERLNDAINKNL